MRRWVRIWLILAHVLWAVGVSADTASITLSTGSKVHHIQAELAVTPAEREKGLMHRDDFGENDAMLFVFPDAAPRFFWMKNTPISLDILFFSGRGNWLNTHADTIPFSLESLPSHGSARFVLELPAGTAARLGLGEGTHLALPEELRN